MNELVMSRVLNKKYEWVSFFHRKAFCQSHIIKCNGNLLPVKSLYLIKKKNHRSNRASGSGQLDEINLGDMVKIPDETQVSM